MRIKLYVLLLILLFHFQAVKAADTTLYYSDFSNLVLDGTVSDNEYPTTFDVTATSDGSKFLSVSWAHNSTHIAVAMSGHLSGWIGFGMNEPGKGMTGADMIISSVKNGKLISKDYFATGHVLPNEDSDQITIQGAGKEENGVTTIEIVFPLKSSDTAGQDHNWEVGNTYGFFFAAHESSDDLTYHTWHSNPLTVEIADSSKTPAQATVQLGESGQVSQDESPFAPILFWAFITFIAIVVWKNSKYY